MWKIKNGKGFTLVELLVAVMVMAVLVAMAVPIYDRAIEKSRITEVMTNLKRLNESKLRALDMYDVSNLTMGQLDVTLARSNDFSSRLFPAASVESVCAVRLRGPHAGTTFLFMGEEGMNVCRCNKSNQSTTSVCTAYCNQGEHFFCQNKEGTSSCNDYGQVSYTIGNCGATIEDIQD